MKLILYSNILKEAERTEELSNGTLYTKLQRKIPESQLSQYHIWIFDKSEQLNLVENVYWAGCYLLLNAILLFT